MTPDIQAAIAADQHLRKADHVVAGILIKAFHKGRGYTQLTYSQITHRTGLTLGVVRGSLRRLESTGYFKILRPTQREIDDGLHCLGNRYVPQPVA